MSLMHWLKRTLAGNGKAREIPVAETGPSDPEEAVATERCLRNDFHEEIRFAAYQRAERGTDPRPDFEQQRVSFPKAFRAADGALYRLEDGTLLLRLLLDIPTFDSGDRQYDSWHALYLRPGQTPGTVDGIYCTGGYCLARAVLCRHLQTAPRELWALLKEHGILPGGGRRKGQHKPGEQFRAAVTGDGKELWFHVNDSGQSVTVASYNKFSGELVIPETVDALPVTGIDASAFSGCRTLSRVTIPGTVRTIGPTAFLVCGGLKEVTLARGLQQIGERAWEYCEALEQIDLPESVVSIGCRAFRGCRSLKACRLPGSLEQLGADGSYGEVFSGCSSLERLEAASSCAACRVTDGVLFSPDGKKLWQYPAGKREAAYTVPQGTEQIWNAAFAGSIHLRQVRLPEGVQGIGASAFAGCTGLEELCLPDSLSSMGKRAFDGCTALSSIRIPKGLGRLNPETWIGCSFAEIRAEADHPFYRERDGVLFDKSGETLVCCPRRGRRACSVPEGVKRIGDYAFEGCRDLEKVTFPRSLEEIGKGAFQGCAALEEVHFSETATQIGQEAFAGCCSLKKLALPEGVQSFGEAAFRGCSRLEQVVLPGSLCKISRYGFAGCDALTSIHLPEGLTAIASSAFSHCGLKEMILPRSIRYIGRTAFYECTLPRVVFRGSREAWYKQVDLDDDAFDESGIRGVTFLEEEKPDP